jgi:hypothetical protein
MGRQIVYCEGCGHNLREDDFEKGRARMIDNKPFCIECRPVQPGDVEQQPRRSSSGKVAAQSRKNTTGNIPIIPAPRRSPAAIAQSNPIPIIAGVCGVVLVILIFMAMSGGSRPTR